MHSQSIDLHEAVEADRDKAHQQFEAAVCDLRDWTTTAAAELPLHRFETELFVRLMALGCRLVALWWSWRLPTSTPRVLRRGRASYLYRGRSNNHVRTRFGVLWLRRPVYELVGHSRFAGSLPVGRRADRLVDVVGLLRPGPLPRVSPGRRRHLWTASTLAWNRTCVFRGRR